MDETKIGFWSGANYMKRDSSTGSTTVTVGSGSHTTTTVTHNLGHIPHYDTYASLQSNGIYWGRSILYVGMEDASTSPNYPILSSWPTSTDLTIRIDNFTGGTKTVTIYWVIYKDYNE